MYREKDVRKNRTHLIVGLAIVLLFSIAANAQLELGDNAKMTLSGNLGFGYTGVFGDSGVSSAHSVGFQSDANLTGYYFNPNFISFNFRPYFDRQQLNSESQIVTRATGLGGEIGVFGGSRFPGSISYSKDFSNNSQFLVAGVPSVIGDTSSQTFAVSWSALLPKYPQVRVSYASGTSSSTVTGLEGASDNSSRNFSINGTYSVKGFNLQGNMNKFWNHFTTPGFLTATPVTSGGSSTIYAFSAQHNMPLNGSFGVGLGHSVFDGEDGTKWSSNFYNGGVSLRPLSRLSFNQNVSYTTNLSAYLVQSLNGGVTPQTLRFGNDTDSLYLSSIATLRLFKGLAVNGYYNHREQTLRDRDYSDSQYGATLAYNYTSPILGILYFGFGVIDTANKMGNQGMGITANVGANKKFHGWETSGDFNYQQNVQTLVAVSTSSSFNYGGSIRRRFNRDTFFTTFVRASHSALVRQDGEGSRAESFGASYAWRKYSVSGSYSQSNGTAVLTSAGNLVSVPVGPLITDSFIYFNAKAYSISATCVPFSRLSLIGGYVNTFSSTREPLSGVTNNGERYNFRMEYRLRKFSIIGGFTRNMQDISAVPGAPRVVNSYYMSLSRWFNVF
jgi:hypothetical protein